MNLLKHSLATACALAALAMGATSCGSDNDDITPDTPPTPETPTTIQQPAGTNYFALNGDLASLTYATSNDLWQYNTLTQSHSYTFDANHRITLATGLVSGEKHPIVYGDNSVTISHNSGTEDVYEYLMENGLVVQCNRNGKPMYKWEYDSSKRVVRAISLLTGGGIANAWTATWNADGDLVQVVCENITDYDGGKANFGDTYTFTYGTEQLTNPLVLQMHMRRPASSTMFFLKLNPILLAQGYYGNTVPTHLPVTISELDTSKGTSGPYTVTDYRYTINSRKQVTRVETMYTEGINATNYHYGECQEYTWK